MKELIKYLWIARIAVRSNAAYFSEVAGRVIFFTIILYIFLRLWKVTYGDTGVTQLGGLTITQMLWYLMITEAMLMSGPRVSIAIDEDVRSGGLAAQLVRPMSYALYRMASNFGERAFRFAVNLFVGTFVALTLVGPLKLTALAVVALLLTVPLAFLLDFLGNFLVGLGAFWLEDTNGLLLLYSRGTLIAGGTLIPLKLYPPATQEFLSWLPFANITAGPARIFVDPAVPDLMILLMKQSVAAAVMGLVVFITYRVALRRVFVNGG